MKDFLLTYIIVLIILFVFMFFGGFVLFDFSGHFWLACVSVSFIAALVIYAFMQQSEKIEELEKRLADIENQMKGAE